MFKIEYSRESLKALKKMPRNSSKLIRSKIENLAENPYHQNNNVIQLTGSEEYRLRVGNWRVFYTLKDKLLTIDILKIKPRGGAYQ